MALHIFPFESELQNNLPEAAPASPSLSPRFSEKLALYGSTALSGLEHLALLVGNEEIASALIRNFGSIKALSRAFFQQIRQFLPRRKAEAVVAAFSVSVIAESEHARSEVFDNPESVYRACADMKLLNQEVLRIVLLDAKRRLISMVDITNGTLNESLAHPREIFRGVVSSNSAYAFVLVHNHPSGDPAPSECDIRICSNLPRPASTILSISVSSCIASRVVRKRDLANGRKNRPSRRIKSRASATRTAPRPRRKSIAAAWSSRATLDRSKRWLIAIDSARGGPEGLGSGSP
ncbi:MAG: hypothetical protein JO232_15740 [Verrucomicrobia bacterium]|nr:hypothetical protein [Verrucomicrobiota bacterium]